MDLSEHPLRVCVEVAVDPDPFPVDDAGSHGFPHEISRRCSVLAASEDEKVGDGLGARCTAMGACGQPNGAHEVRKRVHLASRGRIDLVHRERAGEHGGDAARADSIQRLHDEVIVHAVPVRIAERVVQHDAIERDVADHRVELAAREPRISEALRADLSARIESARDRGRGGVQLDADHPGLIGGKTDERSCP